MFQLQKDHWKEDEDEGALEALTGDLLESLKSGVEDKDEPQVLLALRHVSR